jgi:tetratricopeptide (TPR) repeat protein
MSDDERDALHLARDPRDRVRAVAHEVFAQEQVFGGIAAHCELGRDHDVGAARASTRGEIDDARDIAREISYRRVQLRNRNSHHCNISSASMIPRHWLHYQLAHFYLAMRRPERAARAFEAALAANPRYALAAACLGFLHATHHRNDEAISAFERALAIDPGNADVWFDLGYVHQQRQDHDNALRSFRRATELRPSLDRAWFGIGMVHTARGEYEPAIPAFRKAAELQPFNPHAFYELAKAHHALHHVEDVRKIIKRVSDFDPQITNQLIRETGLLPFGVEPTQRAQAARR